MRILLVGPDQEENLSLRYLSSSLRAAGHEAAIAVFDTAADAEAVVAAAANVDAVGLSMCYQVRAREFLALACALKQTYPDRRVFAGGHYASCAADDLLARHPELDLIAVHECEQTIVELASLGHWRASELGRIAGVVFRSGAQIVHTQPRTALSDLDSLPWPDRTGPARLMAGVPTAYMMGSRGCLSACDYCCITTMHRMVEGERFRQRSPENIVAEMAWLYHERGVRQFIFHDDNFLVPDVATNLDRIEAIDRCMRRQGLRRVALALKCRPGDVQREVFLRLREMGLLRVFLGIESGSRVGLASIGRRQTVAEEHLALDTCEDLGISTQYTIIMFHPEATLTSMREDLDFVARHPGFPLSYCRAEIYTGTPLERRMLRQGRAYGDYMARAYAYTDPLTAHAWSAAWSLLAQRCFASDHVLGQIVRLDHQATVLRHFYEGRTVDALVADFMAFERETQVETVDVFRELFDLCEAHPDPGSPEFRAGYARLREQEQMLCDLRLRRACAFGAAIREQSLGQIGLADLARSGRTTGADARFLERLPRHAAAVFLAVGLMGCASNGAEVPPDGATDQASATDSRPTADGPAGADSKPITDTFVYKDQGGMFEAPPPPMDAPITKRDSAATDGQPDAAPAGDGAGDGGSGGGDGASSLDGGVDGGNTDLPSARDTIVFKDQGGMFEAPPPPMDAPLPGPDASRDTRKD
jgi:anaerobic magnesium-protoporphyrin IX monomethyl ester cyclase